MTHKPLSICYLPGREYAYVRTRVVLKGLATTGARVFDCSYPTRSPWRNFVSFFKFLGAKGKSDVIYVGFLGQFLMPFVRACTRKKIIFEAFVSIYQTLAFDRQRIKPQGLAATFVRWLEKKGCDLADLIYLDTQCQIDYFVTEYGLNRKKFKRVWMSCDDSIMVPGKKEESAAFCVHFHGEFQALHGAPTIVKAAALLPQISFQMIGQGVQLAQCQELAQELKATNITFIGSLSYEELARAMRKADVCLGLFGSTQKTQLVIPFKVYEALAIAKAVITADTSAARELLTHRENVYFCKTADEYSLAEAIRTLHKDSELREHIARNGHELYRRQCSSAVIAREIVNDAAQLAGKENHA